MYRKFGNAHFFIVRCKMATVETGWERNKRTHFNDIVEDYDKMRPVTRVSFLTML